MSFLARLPLHLPHGGSSTPTTAKFGSARRIGLAGFIPGSCCTTTTLYRFQKVSSELFCNAIIGGLIVLRFVLLGFVVHFH